MLLRYVTFRCRRFGATVLALTVSALGHIGAGFSARRWKVTVSDPICLLCQSHMPAGTLKSAKLALMPTLRMRQQGVSRE